MTLRWKTRVLAVWLVACGDGGSSAKPGAGAGEPEPDAGANAETDADGEDASDAEVALDGGDCVEHPETHVEIINACTDAERVTKTPSLPLLLSDGALPPLP